MCVCVFCVCRTTDGHCRVLSLWKPLYLPEGQERGVCARHGEYTYITPPYFTRNRTSMACRQSSRTPVCPTLLLAVVKKNMYICPRCFTELQNHTVKNSLLQSVWGSKMLSVLEQDVYFLNFFTGLDITTNCGLKGHFHREKHVCEILSTKWSKQPTSEDT